MTTKLLTGDRFLVIGRAGMDLYADPPGARVEEAHTFTAALGGSSANIAVAIARQGGQAALVTRISDDAVGTFCEAQLDTYGVDRAHVRREGGEARNSLAVVATRLDDTQSVIYRNNAADFAMNKSDVDAVDYSRFDALITTGTVLASEPSRSAMMHGFGLARAAGLTTIFDIDYRPYSWASAAEAETVFSEAAALSDIIIGNDVEFGFMAGSPDRGLDKARALVRDGAKVAVYKMGEKGAVTITQDGEIRTGIFETQALKPTGAGDAFMGGFVSSLARDVDLEQAVLRGSAAAAMVVARVGCAPAMPTWEEVDAFLSTHPGPTAGD